MGFTLGGRFRGFVILAAVGLLLWAAYDLLWPTYSGEKYLDPDEVRLVAISHGRETYEVHRQRASGVLGQVLHALNAGRRTFPQRRVDFGEGMIVVHRQRGRPILIEYGRTRPEGPMLFRDETAATYPSWTVYRCPALEKAILAVRTSENCAAKRPKVAPESVSRIVVNSPGPPRTLAPSDGHAASVLNALNDFLSSVDTSFYRLPNDETLRSFYMGEVNPQTHLTGTTGALLTVNPPLSMHTNMMFWERQSGPRAEYHEFKTDMILISDALTIKDSYSPEPRKVIGFSSDEKANRFYLFDADIPRTPEQATAIAEKWNKIMRAIEDAVGKPGLPPS